MKEPKHRLLITHKDFSDRPLMDFIQGPAKIIIAAVTQWKFNQQSDTPMTIRGHDYRDQPIQVTVRPSAVLSMVQMEPLETDELTEESSS